MIWFSTAISVSLPAEWVQRGMATLPSLVVSPPLAWLLQPTASASGTRVAIAVVRAARRRDRDVGRWDMGVFLSGWWAAAGATARPGLDRAGCGVCRVRSALRKAAYVVSRWVPWRAGR